MRLKPYYEKVKTKKSEIKKEKNFNTKTVEPSASNSNEKQTVEQIENSHIENVQTVNVKHEQLDSSDDVDRSFTQKSTKSTDSNVGSYFSVVFI